MNSLASRTTRTQLTGLALAFAGGHLCSSGHGLTGLSVLALGVSAILGARNLTQWLSGLTGLAALTFAIAGAVSLNDSHWPAALIAATISLAFAALTAHAWRHT